MDTNMNRRRLLGGLAIAPVAAATPAVAAPLSQMDRLANALQEVKAVALELWPDIDWQCVHIGTPGDVHEGCPVLLSMTPKPEPKYEKWSGPGRYEIEHGNARPIYWVERTPTGSYRACHRWKGKREGGWKRFTEATLKIIRKMPGAA